jgi:hypothetical protein
MYDGFFIIGRNSCGNDGEISAYRYGERGGYETRPPTSVPRANHDRDSKHNETAFNDARQK